MSKEAAIALGRQLFFDPALSGRGHTACATCHNPDYAYGDPRPVSISDDGQPGLRNAPSLLNVGFRPRLMWDGRFGSLEEQVFGPFRRDGEMGIGIEDPRPGSPGEFYWVGAYGTAFWVDPKEKLIAILMTQTPIDQVSHYRSLLRNLVYQALVN